MAKAQNIVVRPTDIPTKDLSLEVFIGTLRTIPLNITGYSLMGWGPTHSKRIGELARKYIGTSG